MTGASRMPATPSPALNRREDGMARYLIRWIKEDISTAARIIRRIVLYMAVCSLLSRTMSKANKESGNGRTPNARRSHESPQG